MLESGRRERLAAGPRSRPVPADDQTIDQIGRRRHHLVARRTGQQPLLNRLALISQQLGHRDATRVVHHMGIRVQRLRHT